MIEDNRTEQEKLARLRELMEPIDQQLMMCDDYRDQLLLVSAMMVTCKQVLDLHTGEESRKQVFKRFTE